MPGHKAAKEFKKYFPHAEKDITELSFSDDLQSPCGVIQKAQNSVAKIIGAKRAFFTTDGSSSGIFALVYAAKKHGDKILIFKNSHKSVYNACKILNVQPIIIQGEYKEGILIAPTVCAVERVLKIQNGVGALFITSPDYYGNIAPLNEYAQLAKKYNVLFLCDGAHGAHLSFGEDKPLHCGLYCNAWVDGAHKSLPTLTQGAVVCASDDRLAAEIEEGLNIFRTTSPSYPIMASVEFGYAYVANNLDKITALKKEVVRFKSKLNQLTFRSSYDWTKLVLDCKASGISAENTAKYLEKKGVYIEMNDGRYLLFYLSPLTEKKQLVKLEKILIKGYNKNKFKGESPVRNKMPECERYVNYLTAVNAQSEYVSLNSAKGRIAAENAGISPPCTPVVTAGEKITDEVIGILKNNENVFGVLNGKIKVIKG